MTPIEYGISRQIKCLETEYNAQPMEMRILLGHEDLQSIIKSNPMYRDVTKGRLYSTLWEIEVLEVVGLREPLVVMISRSRGRH